MIESLKKKNEKQVYSKVLRSGRKSYFFDVKEFQDKDSYLTITESNKKVDKEGNIRYEKQKIHLNKEDLLRFQKKFEEVSNYMIIDSNLENS